MILIHSGEISNPDSNIVIYDDNDPNSTTMVNLTDADSAGWYLLESLFKQHSSFQLKVEECCLLNAKTAIIYVCKIVKERWPKGESILKTNQEIFVQYVKYVASHILRDVDDFDMRMIAFADADPDIAKIIEDQILVDDGVYVSPHIGRMYE